MNTESTPGSSPSPNPETQKEPPKTGLLTLIVHHSITVVILVLALALGIWGYLNFQDTDFFATVDREQLDAKLHPALDRAQHQRIEVSLEVHQLLFDDHPNNLDELVDTGLLVPSDLYYPRGPDSWVYQRRGDNFELRATSQPEAQ